MSSVHLGLQQPRFYFPMLFYPSLVAPTPSSIKENGISVYSNRQSTVGAGPSKNSGVQEVRIVGGAEAAKNSWPGIVSCFLISLFFPYVLFDELQFNATTI